MSKDLNRVQLIGRLGGEPEMKYTGNGSALATFRMATERSYKNAEGEAVRETEWHQLTAWNKVGEICGQYLHKGSRVFVEGRLRTRSWDDAQSGQKRSATEIIVDEVIMLDGRRGGDVREVEDDVGDVGEEGPLSSFGDQPAEEPSATTPAAQTPIRRPPRASK